MNANVRFEITAHAFWLATGFIAPGKDCPPDLQQNPHLRQAAWDNWNRENHRTVSDMLAAFSHVIGAAL